ncbi:NAD/NADP octopine/nopaline dehydrogenase family protein [Dehalobacter sp. TeCB1]|uniref:NAD/NADP octopine/nopaline dehydrogenase family protein n=1 Tax=Dehalobacter sp. TeCB1 TaxID=1843715 RepID=UPI00083A8CE2|nr:NAD/NADP octopine/nopaline dehydrogenase family protein [Dehalobacter sp. TeCB1]OCZ49438.1 NAD/NADP octopine/nopaline dehydrogenase [Dehalobacter sp. TeCB1]
MNITIIGVGNAGSTVAVDLTLKGHRVTLLKTSNSLHMEHFKYLREKRTLSIEECGEIRTANIHCVTTNFTEALTLDTDLIILYIQTNYHESIIKQIVPYLHDGQIILFEPGYLSTAYLLKYTSKNIISVEAESSPIDCRIVSPGICSVLFKNVRNPVGVFPYSSAENTMKKLAELDYHFYLLDSVVEAALHNPNLIVHTVGAIMSIPRIEYSKGEYWMYKEVFTPSVWNLVETLDFEKIEILKYMGLQQQKYVDACKFRNFENLTIDSLEAFYDYANNYSPKGPDVPDSRYITEDVSQGLCLLESLGKVFSISTPVTTALIEIASKSLRKDFRMCGRTIERLGENNIKKILTDHITYKS